MVGAQKKMGRLIERVGRLVTFEKDKESFTIKACIWPKDGGLPTPLENGRLDKGRYRLLFPANMASARLEEGDMLLCGNETYYLETVQDWRDGEKVAFRSGNALRSREEIAEEGTS